MAVTSDMTAAVLKKIREHIGSRDHPGATKDKPGLMSADDKKALDYLRNHGFSPGMFFPSFIFDAGGPEVEEATFMIDGGKPDGSGGWFGPTGPKSGLIIGNASYTEGKEKIWFEEEGK